MKPKIFYLLSFTWQGKPFYFTGFGILAPLEPLFCTNPDKAFRFFTLSNAEKIQTRLKDYKPEVSSTLDI